MSAFVDNSKQAWSDAWSKQNFDSSISGVIGGLSGIVGGFGENSKVKDTSNYQNQIDDINATQFNYGDYDSLVGAYNPISIDSLSSRDLRTSDGQRTISTFKSVGSGALAGAQVGGPVGAIVGGAAGLLSSIGGMFVGNKKAREEARRLNQEATDAKNRYIANFSNNANNIAQNKFNIAALNLAAFGGMLKSNNIDNFTKSKVRLAAFGGDMFSPIGREDGFTNGVVKINEGGSHESNPNDGVLMGVDPQGTPNLVEEGEVIFNDYVFSNRLSPTEQQLEEVKLPKKFAGMPYSKVAEKLGEESAINPLDKISRNTLTDSMMKLTTIQEQSRERDREYEAFDNLEQMFADGGDIHIKKENKGKFTAAAKKHGMGVQEFASKVLANKEKYSPTLVKRANFAQNSAKWHAFGGPIGNMFAGNGDEENELYYFGQYTPLKTDYSKIPYGFDMIQGALSGERAPGFTLEKPKSLEQQYTLPAALEPKPVDWKNAFSDLSFGTDDIYNIPDEPVMLDEKLNLDTTANIPAKRIIAQPKQSSEQNWLTTALRATPVIGSGIQAFSDAMGWSNKEDYSNPTLIRQAARNIRNVSSTPIGRYMSYNPYDVDYEMNRLQNVGLGTQRGLLDTASGNALAARNAMLALNNNLTGQMGDARRAGAQTNEQRRQAIQQFNTGIDQFNSQQALQAGVYNQRADMEKVDAAYREAMLRDQIESAMSQARSGNYTNFLNNAGQWGNDRTYAGMADWWMKNVAPQNDAIRGYGYTRAAKGGKIRAFKKK